MSDKKPHLHVDMLSGSYITGGCRVAVQGGDEAVLLMLGTLCCTLRNKYHFPVELLEAVLHAAPVLDGGSYPGVTKQVDDLMKQNPDMSFDEALEIAMREVRTMAKRIPTLHVEIHNYKQGNGQSEGELSISCSAPAEAALHMTAELMGNVAMMVSRNFPDISPSEAIQSILDEAVSVVERDKDVRIDYSVDRVSQ